MILDWANEQVSDSLIAKDLLNAFRDDRLSKDEVLAVLVARAKRQTNNQGVLDFLLRFLKNLQDSKLTSAEIRSVILEWATERVSNNQIAKELLNALTNGQLSKDKVLAVLIAWVKRQTDNQTILALLDGISSEQFDETAVWKALELYLDNSGLDENLVKAIKSAVEDGHITVQEVLQILTVWASAAGKESFAELIEKFNTASPAKAVISWINSRLPQETQTIFKKIHDSIQNEDWLSLLALILGTLDLSLGAKLLSNLANGKFREAAIRELQDILQRAGVNQAGTVTKAIVDLVTGARSLFAEGSEPDASSILNHPAEISRWREIRQVIYTTQLFIGGGSIVSTAPQARPHGEHPTFAEIRRDSQDRGVELKTQL